MNYDKDIHQNYINYITDFCWQLKEVQRDEPSVPGKINGTDFQQFSAYCIFETIREWEGYLDIPSPLGIDEQKLCDKFKEAAKLVFGDAYDEWYRNGETPTEAEEEWRNTC
jgi:hypothetical protein